MIASVLSIAGTDPSSWPCIWTCSRASGSRAPPASRRRPPAEARLILSGVSPTDGVKASACCERDRPSARRALCPCGPYRPSRLEFQEIITRQISPEMRSCIDECLRCYQAWTNACAATRPASAPR